jgi:hypothetical protein
VEDADRRGETSDVRITVPFESQHVTYPDLTLSDACDQTRYSERHEHAATFCQSIEPGRQNLSRACVHKDRVKVAV